MSEPVTYLLGEMDPARAASFERAMATDAQLRAEVERLRPVVTKLERLPGAAWEGVDPPPLVLPPMPRPRRDRAVHPARRLVLRPLVAAVCALALLGAGAAVGALLDREPAPSAQLALRPVGDLDPSASGRVGLTGDRMTVRVSGLRPTAGGEFYELWLLGAGKQLVGLGAFRVGGDGNATLRLPLPVDPARFAFFDLSLEPGDGNPGHSGLSVLRGPAND